MLIWPFLESGLTDDWSTVRTAQLLAATGHIHYNGWEAAILGWPLYVAAAFIRLFGPSFTSIRSSNLLESVVAVVLLYRTSLRCGLSPYNACFGVLALALTPIYLLASVLFMTDVPGLLAMLVCFYACLRALETLAPERAAGWIAFAALSNAVLGTSRQIAWVGALVMVPCAMWLLRRSRVVVVTGVLSWLASAAIIAASLRWFNHQPYILVAPIIHHPIHELSILTVLGIALRTLLDLILFLLPVAFAFLPAFRRAQRTTWITLGVVGGLLLVGAVTAHYTIGLKHWLVPFLNFPFVHPHTVENTFTMTTMPIKGPAPRLLGHRSRLAVTLVLLGGIASLIAGFTTRSRATPPLAGRPTWRQLFWLILPACAAYLAFLLIRGSYNFVYDRYLILILPFFLILLLRYLQAHEGTRLPGLSALVLLAMAAYSVVTLHDAFATYRGALAACNEVLAAGYPRTAVDGGWEYNHYTQIVTGTYVHQVGVRLPDGSLLPNFDRDSSTACSMDVAEWTPDLHPFFALAYPGSACPVAPGFRPVEYHTWLPPHVNTIQIVGYNTTAPHTPQIPDP